MKTIWFPAKQHGWGWGWPVAWQGWAVLGVFFALLLFGLFLFPPGPGGLESFLLYAFVLCLVLMAVCWLKGEPPRWRWGRRRTGGG